MARLGVPYFYEESPLIAMADACMAKASSPSPSPSPARAQPEP
jgi:hypothetical protein